MQDTLQEQRKSLRDLHKSVQTIGQMAQLLLETNLTFISL